MCITQDGLRLSHEDQAEQFCRAGAKWIQLRMKGATEQAWLDTAREVVAVCRNFGAVCIINDSVEVAIASRSDGVHLGRGDEDWCSARQRLGNLLLGGTVNNEADATRVLAENCLDYVGVGPWRYTPTKKNLSPVLGESGVRLLISMLDGLPAWVIGGIEPADVPVVRSIGATGIAVASGLVRGNRLDANFKAYAAAWSAEIL